jgi:hypothetical protein
LKEAEQRYFAESALKKEKMKEARAVEVKQRAYDRGFDIISGQKIGDGGIKDQPVGKKLLGDGLGPEAPMRGFAILRESTEGRFHRPQESGPNHDYRQDVLLRGGLQGPRFGSVLQEGKKDYPSDGVEDAFSKNNYDPSRSELSKTGLVEAREPGAFTPRKQPGNPSGDPERRKNWAKGFELG